MVELRDKPGIRNTTETLLTNILADEARAAGHPFRGEATTFEAWDGDTVLGGLTARLGVDWLYIEMLAVTPEARRRGIGQRLVKRAESFAQERGMTGVWVDSFSFQAADWFVALGYQEIGRIDDYPRDQARVFLIRRFSDVPLVRRLSPQEDPGALLSLIRDSFAYMDGRVDPPSSIHRLRVEDVVRQATEGEVWMLVRDRCPVATVFLTPQTDALYLGKLAVAESYRRRGLAHRLITLAGDRAGALGLPRLRLQTRVELHENHAAFAAMGFVPTGSTAHPGFDRPTSLIMEKPLAVTDG